MKTIDQYEEKLIRKKDIHIYKCEKYIKMEVIELMEWAIKLQFQG